MRYRIMLVAMAAILSGLLFSADPAWGEADHTFTGSVTNGPDNHCPTWARDTFTRTTELTATEVPDVWDITQSIDGTWISTSNPAIHGTITGQVRYTVTGTLLADPGAVDDEVDLSAVACKGDAVAPDTTGSWALRYFEPGAVAGPITDWSYVYDTSCDYPFTEDATTDSVGALTFTTVCPTPTVEPTTGAPTVEPTTGAPTVEPTTGAPTIEPTTGAPTVEPTDSAGPTPTSSPTPNLDCEDLNPAQAQAALEADPSDPHGLDGDGDGIACEIDEAGGTGGKGGLPLTGTGVLAIIGAGLMAGGVGIGLRVLARRRQVDLTDATTEFPAVT